MDIKKLIYGEQIDNIFFLLNEIKYKYFSIVLIVFCFNKWVPRMTCASGRNSSDSDFQHRTFGQMVVSIINLVKVMLVTFLSLIVMYSVFGSHLLMYIFSR